MLLIASFFTYNYFPDSIACYSSSSFSVKVLCGEGLMLTFVNHFLLSVFFIIVVNHYCVHVLKVFKTLLHQDGELFGEGADELFMSFQGFDLF